jgi:hypothetical protein
MTASRWCRALVCAAAVLFFASAHADTLHTTGWIQPPPDLFTLHRDGHSDIRPGGVGGFTGTWDGEEIFFWCFDLDQVFSFGQNYTDYTAAPLTGPQLDDVQRLFSIAYSQAITTPHLSAAFQLALWNIEYDTDADAGAGVFHAYNGSAGSASDIAQANIWLAALHDPGVSGAGWEITRLTSSQHQDFVIGVQTLRQRVPEPPVLALVLTACLAGAFFARRKRVGRR